MINDVSPKIKLTVSDNELIRQIVTKSVEKYHLIKSLEEFQVEANAALTKMIEQLGEIDEATNDANMDDDDDDEGMNEDADESKGHTESKKKKH